MRYRIKKELPYLKVGQIIEIDPVLNVVVLYDPTQFEDNREEFGEDLRNVIFGMFKEQREADRADKTEFDDYFEEIYIPEEVEKTKEKTENKTYKKVEYFLQNAKYIVDESKHNCVISDLSDHCFQIRYNNLKLGETEVMVFDGIPYIISYINY